MRKITLFFIAIFTLFSCESEYIYSDKDLGVNFGGTNVTQITSTGAQLSCVISNNANALDQAGFCVDKEKEPMLSTAEKKYELSGVNSASSESATIGCSVTSLEPATQYYVRPYVKIGSDVNYGQTVSFRTLSKSGANELIKLPIVFHIIYRDRTDPKQFVLTPTIKTIVDKCNGMLRNTYPNAKGIDTNIEIELAQYDNKGLLMTEPGIDRIESTEVEYNTKYFAENRKESLVEMWDPSSYINVWIFAFPDNNVVGQSYIAYTTNNNSLSGLIDGDYYFDHKPTYAHGVYMSNKFINNITVFSQSLTHEIGHYLGLFHVFESNSSGTCDIANDYCDDTNTYIRSLYEKNMGAIVGEELYRRKDCITSETYEATNYMDYDYCRFITFTPNQIARMRHVLKNSPLVPGASPSARSTKTEHPVPKARLM